LLIGKSVASAMSVTFWYSFGSSPLKWLRMFFRFSEVPIDIFCSVKYGKNWNNFLKSLSIFDCGYPYSSALTKLSNFEKKKARIFQNKKRKWVFWVPNSCSDWFRMQ
jgi:hypothetical protein